MTRELLALRDWLAAEGVSRVAMEATGVYWKPVFYLLEDLVLVSVASGKVVAVRLR
jgi:transposase